MNKIYATKIGFIGLGKLGMPCAEAVAQKGFDVTGYDIVQKTSKHVEIKDSISETVRDRDIVFVATTVKDYEIMTANFQELRRYIRELGEVIVYYRKVTTNNKEEKATKSKPVDQ